jgi:hypothetical protein
VGVITEREHRTKKVEWRRIAEQHAEMYFGLVSDIK